MRNLPYGFESYLVNVKTIRQIVQIFVAFSKNLNFTLSLHSIHCAAKIELKKGPINKLKHDCVFRKL